MTKTNSTWTKNGNIGKYGIECDIDNNFYLSSDNDEWFKNFTNNLNTVKVIENGPAGGNPLFLMTSDNLDTLKEKLKMYYNGEDYHKYGEWSDLVNDHISETSYKGPNYWN